VLVEKFLEGNRRRYTATFKVPDQNGVLTDPTTITFYRRKEADPNPETYVYNTDIAVVREGQGIYHVDLSYSSSDADGRYWVGVKGTGTCEAFDELEVLVQKAKSKP